MWPGCGLCAWQGGAGAGGGGGREEEEGIERGRRLWSEVKREGSVCVVVWVKGRLREWEGEGRMERVKGRGK